MKKISMKMGIAEIRWFKCHTWRAVFLVGLLFVVVGCNTEEPTYVEVGKIGSSSDMPTLTLDPEQVNALMLEHNRLVKSEFEYDYTHVSMVSFPKQPGEYVHFLAVVAELSSDSKESAPMYYCVYCELLEKEGLLYFVPDNFQQACSSQSCSDCKLVRYQNGRFGCVCNGGESNSTSSCSYEKSRVLTKKQQKSDII